MKKFILSSIITVMILSLCTITTPAGAATATQLRYGDVNGDGSVDSLDLALTKQYMLNLKPTLSQEMFKAADVNVDGHIDSIDLADMKSYCLGLSSVFPVEEYEKIIKPYFLLNGSQKEFEINEIFVNSKGRTVVRTTQTYNGISIVGTENVFHILDGKVEFTISGLLIDIENMLGSSDSQKDFPQQDVINAIGNHLLIQPDVVKVELLKTVLYLYEGKYYYAYKVNVATNTFGTYTYYIDVNNISVLGRTQNFSID